MTTATRILLLGATAAATSTLIAHFTWIGLAVEPLRPGETAHIQIGNGHEFPVSESAISPDNLKVFALSPSGRRDDIQPEKSENFLTAAYPVKEPGVYRFVFVQDRGVISRTTRGFQPGGRDKHPGAVTSMKSFRSAVAYEATPGARMGAAKPVGLPFELTADITGTSVTLTVLKDGRALPDAGLAVVWVGKKEEKIGKSGPDGKFKYTVPSAAKGPFLLLAAVSEPMPKGSTYDSNNYSAALHLDWQ